MQPFKLIPNSLRPVGERDDRPVVYVCYRTWEPIIKWCARMEGGTAWAFAKNRGIAIERAIVEGTGCHFTDHETIREVKASCRIKVFEVRPPRDVQWPAQTFTNTPRKVTP